MKKLYFGSNLKMYKTVAETKAYLKELQELTKDISRDQMELFIMPSFTALEAAAKTVDQDLIRLGSQDMCWEDEGQYTGAISPCMLDELGIRYFMAGHSERRHVFGETDFQENKKMLCGVRHGFHCLLCIGETAEDKEYGISDEVLRRQLKIGLHGIAEDQLKKIRVAYEPVWAIGVNGVPASVEYAAEKHRVIKACLTELYPDGGMHVPVLYGGSVNAGNAEELIVQPHIDGLYVGRSAWVAKDFNALIRSALVAGSKKNSAI